MSNQASDKKPHLTAHSPKVFSQPFRIYLDETDAGGIVYHANYFKLFERCRREWLRHIGMISYFYQQKTANSAENAPDIQFVVSDAKIKYLKPMLLDDLVDITVENVIIKSASFIVEQAIWLKKDGETEPSLLSFATITIACVATTKNDKGQTQIRPAHLPTEFVNIIQPKI